MSKKSISLGEASELDRKKYETVNNTVDMFPVGTRVMVISHMVDFVFFNNELGTVQEVTKGFSYPIKVLFDDLRIGTEEDHLDCWNFRPKDLLPMTTPVITETSFS